MTRRGLEPHQIAFVLLLAAVALLEMYYEFGKAEHISTLLGYSCSCLRTRARASVGGLMHT